MSQGMTHDGRTQEKEDDQLVHFISFSSPAPFLAHDLL